MALNLRQCRQLVRLNDKPTDVEAHFQLGVCYINIGNFSAADERFGSAVRLDAEYGYKIGEKYKIVGDEALQNGRTNKALKLYKKAVKYQPNLKKPIAQKCFAVGKDYLNKYQSGRADRFLSTAVA